MLNNVVQGHGRNLYVKHTSILRNEARQVLYVNRRPVPAAGWRRNQRFAGVDFARSWTLSGYDSERFWWLPVMPRVERKTALAFLSNKWLMSHSTGSFTAGFFFWGGGGKILPPWKPQAVLYFVRRVRVIGERPISNLGRTVRTTWISHFRYIASARSHGTSNPTLSQIENFLFPVEIRGGISGVGELCGT